MVSSPFSINTRDPLGAKLRPIMKAPSAPFQAWWPAVLLATALLGTGCAGVIPLPVSATKVQTGHRLKPAQVAFIQPGQTSRTEVISHLGTNYVALPRERAIAYSWEMKGGGGVWWWWVVGYGSAAGDAGTWTSGWRAFFVAFDEQGFVTSSAFKRPSTGRSLHEHLDHWVSRLPAQSPVVAIH
jgi:hypothetical protein